MKLVIMTVVDVPDVDENGNDTQAKPTASTVFEFSSEDAPTFIIVEHDKDGELQKALVQDYSHWVPLFGTDYVSWRPHNG